MLLRVAGFAILLLLTGCGRIVFNAVTDDDTDSGDTDSSTDTATDTDSDTDSSTDSDWTELLPEDHQACALYQPEMPDVNLAELVVGDGTKVSCTEAALRARIEEANTNKFSHVTFRCGAGPVTIPLTATITVASTASLHLDGAGKVTIDGGGLVPIISAAQEALLILDGLSLVNGFSEVTDGGAVSFPDGGAQGNGKLIIQGCVFKNNRTSGKRGGAVFAESVSSVEIFRSYFEGNTATQGGAVFVLGDSLTLADVAFVGNEATDQGGALFMDGDQRSDFSETFAGCGLSYRDNVSQNHGSAIKTFMYGNNTAVLLESEFINNRTLAAADGYGAFYHAQSPLRIENSTFMGNRSASSAGAVYLDRAMNVAVTNCTFYDNQATGADGHGGAIFVPTGSRADIINCTFSLNTAAFGPALDTPPPPSDTTLNNSLFVDNESTSGNPDIGNACTNTLEGAYSIQYQSWGGPSAVLCTADALTEDPLIDDPADNGGNVFTMAIFEDTSAAVDRAQSSCPSTDARGETRSVPCDAGAFEF